MDYAYKSAIEYVVSDLYILWEIVGNVTPISGDDLARIKAGLA